MKEKITLYKFGKREHIIALAEQGKLFLNLASKFADSRYSKGAFDAGELILNQTIPIETEFQAFSKDGKKKGKFKAISPSPMTIGPVPDALLFCSSFVYNKDLYNEFEADSCLIIEDADRFVNQACKAIMNSIEGSYVDAGSVHYKYEEELYSLDFKNQHVYYNKPAKYAHQKEMRIVATVHNKSELRPTTVYIASIADYCKFTGVELPDSCIDAIDYARSWASPWPRV